MILLPTDRKSLGSTEGKNNSLASEANEKLHLGQRIVDSPDNMEVGI
jgi:hypothetical protein